MQFKDYYDTLGVEPTAGEAELKTAYRRLARKYHPDVSKERDAEARFKAVNEAYEALRDPERRKSYDQLRARGYRPGDEVQAPPGASWWRGQASTMRRYSGGGNGGFSDFFESMFSARANAVAGLFRAAARRHPRTPGGAAGRRAPRRCDAHLGRRAHAAGKGAAWHPPGAGDPPGGQANAAETCCSSRIAHRPALRGRWPQHHLALQVAPWDAALGASVSVPTLGGTVELKVPAGSEAGVDCGCVAVDCRAAAARPMGTRSSRSRSRRRRRAMTPSARPTRPCATRSRAGDCVGAATPRAVFRPRSAARVPCDHADDRVGQFGLGKRLVR